MKSPRGSGAVFTVGVFALAAALAGLFSAGEPRAEDASARALQAAYVTKHKVLLNRRPSPVYGAFQVQVRRNGGWETASTFDANHRYTDHELTLAPLPAGKRVRVAVRAMGGGPAHLDSVTLDGAPPLEVRGAPPAKLTGREYDVADITGKRVELVFAAPTDGAAARLALRGRIESMNISKTPLGFPPRNTHRKIGPDSAFYAYRLGSHPGRLTVDGELAAEKLPEPLFVDNQPIGSGHPQSPTYAWVLNDDTHLYVAIDLTSDNTMDGDLDYAAVYVKRADGVRGYRVSVPEQDWGKPGFTYTHRAPYQHKIYEFSIPLSELGVQPGETAPLQIALEGYGTVAPTVSQQRMRIARDPINHRTLIVYEDWSSSTSYNMVAQMLDQNLQPVGGVLVLQGGLTVSAGEPPAIAFDSTNQRFLVVWLEPPHTFILGRFINSNGTMSGVQMTLHIGSVTDTPALAFNSSDNAFLLVWGDGQRILGARLDTDGTMLNTSEIQIASLGTNFSPAVAYNSVTSGYYVVYVDDDNITSSGSGHGIRGRTVSADGLTIGTEASPPVGALPGVGLSLKRPALAFDSTNERYQVIYEDGTGAIIRAAMRNSDGSVFFDFHNASTNFDLASSPSTKFDPAIVYDPLHQRHFAAWSDFRSGVKTSIYGQWVGTDARLVDPDRTDMLDLTDPAVNLPVLTSDYADTHSSLVFDEVCGNILMGSHIVLDFGDGFDEVRLELTQVGRCSGVNIGQLAGYTTEQGTRDTFSVVLNAEPTGDVTIPISVSDSTEAMVTPASLTFTAANWMTPRQVIVTGVDDSSPDGDVGYNVLFGAITSGDSTYAAISLPALPMSNLDDETAGFLLGTVSGPTTEGGGTATFTVALATQPAANVTTGISSSDTSEGTVSPASLVFTNTSWSTPQTVTVTGIDDSEVDGQQPFHAVTAAATSTDPSYSGRNPPDVLLFNLDDETAGFLLGTVSGPTTEGGGTATFTVALTAQPAADVTTGISSSDTSEGTVSPASLVFTNTSWSTPQTVTVTGIDDTEADGHQPFHVVTAAATSTDPFYSGRNPLDVLLFNLDDESTLLDFAANTTTAVSPASGPSGTEFTFTVVYRSVSNTPPVTHNLQIDLDGDGTFTAGLRDRGVKPTSMPGVMAVAVAMLLFLATGTVFVSPIRIRNLNLTIWVMVVVGSIGAIGMIGCGGGGGGEAGPGPGPEVTPASGSEVIAMVAADANDTNYLDGKTYVVTRAISGDPRAVTFQFSFSEDGINAVQGEASGTKTLTISAQ